MLPLHYTLKLVDTGESNPVRDAVTSRRMPVGTLYFLDFLTRGALGALTVRETVTVLRMVVEPTLIVFLRVLVVVAIILFR